MTTLEIIAEILKEDGLFIEGTTKYSVFINNNSKTNNQKTSYTHQLKLSGDDKIIVYACAIYRIYRYSLSDPQVFAKIGKDLKKELK